MILHRLVEVAIVATLSVTLFTQISVAQQVTRGAQRRTEAPDRIQLSAPDWLADYEFEQETFTFVRAKYTSADDQRYGRRRIRGHVMGRWSTDFPDADLALAAQIDRLTRLNTPEPGLVMDLTDPRLAQHPFLYMAEAGSLRLRMEEATALRKYLEQGGFLMLDDTWGDRELLNIRLELKRIFPHKNLQTLTIDHPIFHNVFDLKEFPQSVSIHSFLAGNAREAKLKAGYYAITEGEASESGKLNPQARLQVLVCHNTDLADGWERAQDSEEFRKQISEPLAFPMGINAVFYALTGGS